MRPHGLRPRLLLLALASTTPFLVLAARDASRGAADARRLAELQTMEDARLIAARVDDHISNVESLLLVLARTLSTSPKDIAENERKLREIRASLPDYYNNVKIRDVEGNALGSSSGLLNKNNDRKYTQEAIATKGIGIGEPVISRSTSAWTLAIARAVLDADDVVVGVVSVSTKLNRFQILLEQGVELPHGSVVTLINESGVVLARSVDGDAWIGKSIADLPAESGMSRLTAGGPPDEVTGADGIERFSGAWGVTRAPWRVLVGIPRSVALAPSDAAMRRALALGAVTFAFAAGLAWFLAGALINPLRQLASDATAFGRGDYRRRTGVFAATEVRALAEAFNGMAETIERSTHELRHLYRSTSDMIFWSDLSAEGRRVLEPNPAFLAAAGPGGTAEGASLSSLLGVEAAAELERVLAECTDSRHTVRLEQTWSLPVGKRSVRVQVVPVEGAGRWRVAVIGQDVTESRNAEEALRQTQKLESLGVLAGGIAHDFNNLLTGVLGNVALARLRVEPGAPVLEQIGGIESAARQAAQLTRQMLTYAGRARSVVEPVDLNEMVRGIGELLAASMSKTARLVLNLDPALPLVLADRAQLEQITMNLVINASEAVGLRRGAIRVSTRSVILTRESRPVLTGEFDVADGNHVVLEVGDDGIGMPPEVAGRIFDPFFTTKFTGRGLGLSAVLGIVRGHRGGLHVATEPGKGTTFTIYFPAHEGAAASRVVTEPSAVPLLAPAVEQLVLLVDDEAGVRKVSRHMAEILGYRVEEATDGSNAIAVFESRPTAFSVVVLDVTMPEMDGIAVLERIRRVSARLPVVLMSGYTDAQDRICDPHVVFLQKPFDLDHLRKAIEAARITAAVAALP